MIKIFTGLPGAGKSYKMAQTILLALNRNAKWYEKTGTVRKVFSNLRLSPTIEEKFPNFIEYWWDPSQLVALRDVDVFWDEIATHLDSTQWQNMSLEIKRWLQQHRKFGIEVYGTTQDFAMIDKSMRRLTSDLFHISKIIGSPDPSPTRPLPKRIWGICTVKELDPQTYDEEVSKQASGLPGFMWLDRNGIDVFDTRQEIKMGKYPPLNHIERECISQGCKFHRIVHA